MSFAPRQIAAVLTLGSIGVLVLGLQPQLLGALAGEGRLSVAALGPLATVELLAMGLAAGGAGFVLPIARLRPVAAAALALVVIADLMTPRLGSGAIFAARTLAGLGEGVLVWIAIGFIVRTAHPERWSGIYLAVQTLAQFALASVFGWIAVTTTSGFQTLALVTLAGAAALPLLPPSFAPLPRDPATGARPSARGLIALLGTLSYLAFVVAIWVYVEPLALARGVPADMVHAIAPLSLAMQVLGAGAATVLAERLPTRATVIAVAAANLALIALMATAGAPIVFMAAAAAFGFLWLFALPFQVPLVIAADPTRRAAALIGGAQLAGSSIGPLIAGSLVVGEVLTPVLWFGAAALVVAVGLLIGASRAR